MNEETMIEEELVEGEDESFDDTGDDKTTDDVDDEFDYDEDGNIIIPDIVDDEDDDDSDDDEDGDGDEVTEDGETDPVTPEKTDSEELVALRTQYAKLKAQSLETLKKLGVTSEDELEGLASLAAEADGVSVEEYLKNKAEAEKTEKAKRLIEQQQYEQIFTSDLAELHAAYPETTQYKHIRDLPKEILTEFSKYREMGIPAKRAYAAANPDGIRTNVASAVKKQSLKDTKSHLHSNVPKGSKDNSVTMPSAVKKEWRDLFPGKTDKELEALYKKTL